MNYFYSKAQQKSIEKMVNSNIFQLLIEYMYQHQKEDIILRDLKKFFPQRQFESFLDQLIEEKLIRRENRRYYLNFPIFNEIEVQEEVEEKAALILQELSSLSKEEKKL